jgi:protein-disulfide isomerase
VVILRRFTLLLLLLCLGCSAQSLSPDLTVKIERQVRSYFNLPPSAKFTFSPLHASEFPNYDALKITIEGEERKQTVDCLLSKDGKTLIRIARMDLTKDPYAEVMKKINISGRPTRGNKDAKVVVVTFDDFECPFCSRMHETLFPEILQEYGDRVKFVYKDYPLPEIHPWATHAAADANCLAAQSNDAYWDFADYIHANQREVTSQKAREEQFTALDHITTSQGQRHNLDESKLQACIKAQNDDAIKASIQEGDSVGVSATPVLFINGQELEGALPIGEVRAALDQALQQAGVPVPAHPAASASNE